MGESHKDDEKQVSASTNKIIPSLSQRGTKLREELLSKIVPWKKITASLQNFPYYIEEHSKSLLVECVASKLKHKKLRKFGARLKSSSHRILLHTIPGTELYREKLVSAIAREVKVPLLKLTLDDHHGCDDGRDDENFSDLDETDDGSDDEDSSDEDDDGSDDEDSSDEDDDGSDDDENHNKVPTLKFNRGDRVKYVGPPISIEEVNNRTLTCDQRGEVYEVNGERVAVVFNICGLKTNTAGKDDINTEILGQALVTWLDVGNVKQDREKRIHDCHIAVEVLYEVLQSQQPMIVYFPDSFLWPPSFMMMENIFNQLPEGVVLICAENNSRDEMKELPEAVKKFVERSKDPPRYGQSKMLELFTNVVGIKPPKDEYLANTFVKQIEKRVEEDRLKVISAGNLKTMHKVLEDHNLSCMNLELVNINDKMLTIEKVEKIVGWAMNHHLSSCTLPCVNEEKLHIPHDSIKLAILRLKEEEGDHKQKKDLRKDVGDLASGKYEAALISAVIRSEDIGVKFDDIGALENVKKLLFETVILPMRRPELFSHGNLLKPCKGILLFGPPGTGKTLMAKALATESGANFINITAAAITSKWLGETENLTRAVFSYARKLAPVIIFIDEVDSLLGARGHNKYGDSRLNEFMAAWDGLITNDSQRILVVGATNRPFDLDDAVLRRMPRRIYVGLPNLENRRKILKILLNKENLESGFSFEQLADATGGYTGSDLKNLCAAAAYRPLEEFLEQESKGEEASDGDPALRPLNVNDFIHSKSKVRASVAEDASSIRLLREWEEKFGGRG